MEVKRTLKAIVYARVSTARNQCRGCGKLFWSSDHEPACPVCGLKDIEKSQEAENQLTILREYCKQHELKLEHEYVDRESGKSEDREQFQAMLKAIRRGQYRGYVLLFWALDRLSREGALATLQYLQLMTDHGLGWKSFTEQYLDSTGLFRDAIVAILATLGKQQRVRISENTKSGLARAAVEGTRSGKAIGRPKASLDEDQARRLVAATSERKAAKTMGVPLSTLRTRLNGRPEPKPKAIIWSDPVWGRFEEGLFVEDEGGKVVVRYDQETGLPWCMNHQKRLGDCRELHEESRKG